MSADRNPSPPPELLQKLQEFVPDRVGDSVFSKQWLIQILIKIVESIKDETLEDKKSKEDSKSAITEEEPVISIDVREVDPKLEDDACALWDMSVNGDVAHFLQEYKVDDILVEAIDKTKCPRLVEIAVGILGNIVSFDDICQDLSNNKELMNTIIPLVGSSDAPTVIQVLRLIHTFVVNEETCPLWLTILRTDAAFMSNLRFIFENSLNGEVLKGALQLLYYVLDSDTTCDKWAEEEYMKSIATVATQSASHKDCAAMDELWLLLNLMCQSERNVIAIGNHFDVLHRVFILYINLFGEYDHTVLPSPDRCAAVCAAYTTFAMISRSNKDCCEQLKDDAFLKTVERMLKSTQSVLAKCTIIGESMDDDDDESSGSEAHVSSQSRLPSSNRNGETDGSVSKNEFCYANKITKDEHNSLFILRETIIEFCSFIAPAIAQNEYADGSDG